MGGAGVHVCGDLIFLAEERDKDRDFNSNQIDFVSRIVCFWLLVCWLLALGFGLHLLCICLTTPAPNVVQMWAKQGHGCHFGWLVATFGWVLDSTLSPAAANWVIGRQRDGQEFRRDHKLH